MSDAKHLIGLFCAGSQSEFIYKLACKPYYELLNFAFDGLILLPINNGSLRKVAICSRWLQFVHVGCNLLEQSARFDCNCTCYFILFYFNNFNLAHKKLNIYTT
jgi:hypothetical protein